MKACPVFSVNVSSVVVPFVAFLDDFVALLQDTKHPKSANNNNDLISVFIGFSLVLLLKFRVF